MILTWIQNTSSPSISNSLGNFDNVNLVWDMLAKQYSTSHGSKEYQLVVKLYQLRKKLGQSINHLYDQLRFIWDQINISDLVWAYSMDVEQYATIQDEFLRYQFMVSLQDAYEPI